VKLSTWLAKVNVFFTYALGLPSAFVMCTWTLLFYYCLVTINLSPNYSFSFRLSHFVLIPVHPTTPQTKEQQCVKVGQDYRF
jgi:hypothetical protein